MEHNGEHPVEYIGVGKPEIEKRSHPVVEKVHQALGRWWERVGPGSVEKSWVAAHGRILNKIDGEDRKQAFEKSTETWRKVGKGLGIASTAIDFSLAGLGVFVSVSGWRNGPRTAELLDTHFIRPLAGSRLSFITRLYDGLLRVQTAQAANGTAYTLPDNRPDQVGKAVSVLPAIGSLGILGATGPAHIASRVAARVAGIAGQGIAGGGNYVASGKAKEHAGKIGKGVGSVAKYAAEHPEEVRKTFETVERVKRENEQHKEAMARLQREEAQRRLKQEYDEWLKGIDPGIKAFYKNSNTWPPPMETMMQERSRQSNTQQPRNRR